MSKPPCPAGSEEAARALAASEVRYRRLFEAAKDGILILDAETGMVVDVNPFLMELLGYSREDFLDKRVWELGFFKNLAANEKKFLELQARDYVRYENLPLETADGQVREVEFVSNIYLADGKRVIQCNIRDITERKRAERRLEENDRELKRVNEDLTAFNRAMVGRELRMIELKKEINKLCHQFGLPARFQSYSDKEL